MWFRNLRIYTLASDFVMPEQLEQALEPMRFKPCGRSDRASFGWASPFGRDSEVLSHKIGHCYLVTARKEEKVLPSSVVNGQLDELVAQQEAELARKLPSKEKQAMKEDLIHRLLPQAFSKFKHIGAMIDTQLGIVVVDASSASAAEDLLGLLRNSFGSLPVKPWFAEQPTELYFTQFLRQQQLVDGFEFGAEVELRDANDSGAVVRCRQHDLSGTEIETHLAHNKQVTKLALLWQQRLQFVLEQDLAIKRFKPTDVLIDEQDKLVDATPEQRVDADFALLSGEIAQLFPQLVGLFQTELSVD
jgi:recombination associated protein RdgC